MAEAGGPFSLRGLDLGPHIIARLIKTPLELVSGRP
jgi:hypothetical protein